MVEILAAYASKQPDHLFAADYRGNEYTYSGAWTLAKALKEVLTVHFRLNTGDKLMAECNQTVPYLILDLACELAGIVFIPVENQASFERKTTIAKETESTLWVHDSEALPSVTSVSYEELFRGTDQFQPAVPDRETVCFPDGKAIAEILYTTGTTGTSKGIVITNEANVALAENIKYGVNMKAENVEIIPVPISHSHGLRCCYANLLNGGTIVLVDGLLRVQVLFDLMTRYHVTAMDVSPNAALMLIKLSKGSFWKYAGKLDYIQLGTASLPESLKIDLVKNLPGVHLYNFYGSTESGRSCVLDFSIDSGKVSCIGKPTVNSEIVFTNDNRQFITATETNPGLLASRGTMNMHCYWKNPQLTEETMRNNYIFTNDLGYMDPDGYVYVFGRKDDVINYNGIKIAPSEIEEIAVRFEGIRDAACVPMPDKTGAGQAPRLFIVAENETSFNKKGFSEFLSKHIDGNKVPKRIDILDEIPRTFNGKIKRKDLANLPL